MEYLESASNQTHMRPDRREKDMGNKRTNKSMYPEPYETEKDRIEESINTLAKGIEVQMKQLHNDIQEVKTALFLLLN